jgi:transposase
MLEDIWPRLKEQFDPHTIVINADNGPENSSRRTQFIKRLVDFSQSEQVSVELAYYPPYHSKYNPIERVWGVLENHWNGEILDIVEKAIIQNQTYITVKPRFFLKSLASMTVLMSQPSPGS